MRALKRIRAVRSGINTGVNKSGLTFWSSMPSDLLRRTAYNADVVRTCGSTDIVYIVLRDIVI